MKYPINRALTLFPSVIAVFIFFSLNFASVAISAESGTYAPGVSPASFSIDAGKVVLKMIPDNDTLGASYFKFLNPDGSLKWVQKFSQAKKCDYQSTGTNVVPTASGGGVGYREGSGGYGIGVNASEGTGSCNQLNKAEVLALDFRNSLEANRFLDFTVMDMEFKYTDTVLTVKLYKDANTDTNPTNLVYTYTRSCNSSDCGPDSGGNDNRSVRIPVGTDRVYFNRMVFTVASSGPQAAATLKGGVDPGTQASLFHVAIPGTPVTCGVDIPTSGGGTNATVNFFPDSGQPCPVDKSYFFTTGIKSTEIRTGGSSAHLNSIVHSTWAPEPAQTPVPPSVVYPPDAGENEVWCNGTPNFPLMPGQHTWCRISENTQVAGDGLMQVNETSLLIGDALIQRH